MSRDLSQEINRVKPKTKKWKEMDLEEQKQVVFDLQVLCGNLGFYKTGIEIYRFLVDED